MGGVLGTPLWVRSLKSSFYKPCLAGRSRGESIVAPVKTREIKNSEFIRIKHLMGESEEMFGVRGVGKGRRGHSFSEIRTWSLRFRWSYVMPLFPLRGKLEGLDIHHVKWKNSTAVSQVGT